MRTQLKPVGLLLFFFRLPLLLYRFGFGALFGERFLRLSHIGRKSGRVRRTVIEVIRSDREAGTYMVASGFGPKSDWFQNIERNPNVLVTVGPRIVPARAEQLSIEESARELREYAQRHPVAYRLISLMLLGEISALNDDGLREMAQKMPVVWFRCA